MLVAFERALWRYRSGEGEEPMETVLKAVYGWEPLYDCDAHAFEMQAFEEHAVDVHLYQLVSLDLQGSTTSSPEAQDNNC